MTIKFFAPVETSSGDLPFVEDYAKASAANRMHPYEVREVILTRKGTGYLLKTNQFLVFLFKRMELCKQVIAGLEMYQQDGNGYGLYAQPMKDAPYFQLGFDDQEPRHWRLSPEGKYLALPVMTTSSLEEVEQSEVLIQVPLPPTHPGRANTNSTTQKTSKKSTSVL